MLKTLTKKLRRHSLNEIHPFQLKISYHGSEEGWESEDSEGENQELAQIDREHRRNCALTPLATSQQHNQGILSPAHLRRLRLLLDPALERHSSEEELERIAGAIGAEGGRKWHRHGDMSSASSDEEVKDLCGPNEPATGTNLSATSPSPVLFSSSPPRGLKPSYTPARLPVRPIILSHFEQPSMPYWRHRPIYTGEPGRPSLDLEKMQQKMLLRKNCGGKTRTIKIRSLTGGRHTPRYSYDPSIFAFRPVSNVPPCSPVLPAEEPPCA
ncbi:uncharacterized protein si:dkey-16j16.4 [Danio rerio]|uniref:Si:dkey-16j16.4 n=1 Tax=Danio rerio TaxID=7955 RepID=E7EY77_DANRE|nr:uncharacterized protein si:dkey-16j16.4 [Danio rerio]|eukprot:XP_002665267.1 uncharacterized protein si:dkey-16j16.4 [Danio rerio]